MRSQWAQLLCLDFTSTSAEQLSVAALRWVELVPEVVIVVVVVIV